jgi:hypothetical protein
MNALELFLVPDRVRTSDFAVAVQIDGEPLTEQVRKIEARHRQAAGCDPTACRYTWVQARVMLLPGLHWMGVSASPWCPGFSEVLVCTCGEAACGSIAVSVRVSPGYVGWLAWRQFPLREACPHFEFRPLLFRRSQYEAELIRVSEEYRRTKTGT